ncbi:MAG: hypothetical protein J6W31_07165, partial [Clostridia bacterium]|nr:hypothetical protein [Clostridia bacterium]
REDGTNYYFEDKENFWRVYRYIPNTITYDQAEDPTVLKNAGYSFGLFQRQLSDFPMDKLVDTTYTGEKDKRLTIFPKGEDGKLVECSLWQAPKYGSVQQANNGRFYYYPAEGFTGTDTFVVYDPYTPDAEGTVITVIIE